MSFWFCPPRVHCSVLARVTSTLKVYVSGVGRGEPSVTGIEQQKEIDRRLEKKTEDHTKGEQEIQISSQSAHCDSGR